MAGKSKCGTEGCLKWSVARGHCSYHSRQMDGRIVRCEVEGCRRRAAVTRQDGLCVFHACPHRRCGVVSCEKLKQWQSPFCINHTRIIGPSGFPGVSETPLLTPSISLPDFFLDPISGMVLADAAKQHLNELLFQQGDNVENILSLFNQHTSLPSQ